MESNSIFYHSGTGDGEFRPERVEREPLNHWEPLGS
jgi:hypothetical protein